MISKTPKNQYKNYHPYRKRNEKALIYLFLLISSMLLLLIITNKLLGQTTGDYRSYQSGVWNSVNNWERYNGSTWVNPAPSVPSSSDGTITIRNGHTIEISSNVTIDQVVIEAGGTINWTGGTITVANGTGDDLVIYGTFRHNLNASVPTVNASATISVESGGVIDIANGGHSECDYYASNENSSFASKMIWKNASVFQWSNTNLFSTSNLTYFPNVGSSVIPVFRITGNTTYYVGAGASNPTLINGILEVNSPAVVFWQYGGTKTFRNGITGTGNIFQRSGTNTCGQFRITGNATLSGSGGLTLNSNGLSIDSGATLTITENKTISVNASTDPVSIASGGKIEINPGVTLTINGSLSNSAGNSGLVIKSDATGTGNLIHNTQNVQGTVERYMTGDATNKPYHFVSAPVKDGSFSQIWQSGDYNVYYYNESNTDTSRDVGWTRITGGTLTAGRGYAIVSNYSSRTLSFEGKLTVPADISSQVTVSYTSSGNSVADGWNLIGNPYPCAINGTTFLTDNSSNLDATYGAIYLWDDANGVISRLSDYATFNKAGGTPGTSAAPGNSSKTPNGTIAVGQAFFVKVKSGVSSLSFAAAQRTGNTSSQFFIPDVNAFKRIWLAVKGPENLYNETLVAFTNEATMEHDPFYDAVKLKGNPYISIYSKINGYPDDYAIQTLPDTGYNFSVPLGIDAGVDGYYTFFARETENFPPQFKIYLTDLLTNQTVELSLYDSLKIYLKKGRYSSRFVLHFNLLSHLGDNEISDNKTIQLITSNRSAELILPSNQFLHKITLLNIGNQKVREYIVNQTDMKYLKLDLSNLGAGLYLLQIQGSKGTYYQKLFNF